MASVGRLRQLGGSWVVTSGVISPLTYVITIIILLTTILITTHEPPRTGDLKKYVFRFPWRRDV